MDHWLGIDCGGTVLKAGIYDASGREVGVCRRSLTVLNSQPGWAERDMAALWSACGDVIHDVLLKTALPAASIAGIAISAQGKGLFLLDKKQQPLGMGILSSDQRALQQVRQWQREELPARLYPLTRQTLWTGHPATLLRWVKDQQPERYAQIGAVLMVHDYLRFCLTGELACEETNISESNLYHMEQGDYSDDLLAMQGIGDIRTALPPVIGSAQLAGRITAQAAEKTGLLAGTPVYGGLFDVVSTALCAGLNDEETLNAVMGTWSVTSGVTDHIDYRQNDAFVYGRYAEAGKYIVHAASPTSAGNLEWFIKQWGITDYQSINDDVASLAKASSDLYFIPFLYGSNAGSGMSAGFYGLQALHEKKHLLQAIYEGVVFSHMTHLNFLKKRFPHAKTLRLTGGPARSNVWMQMFADVSGFAIELPKIEETGCLGAAFAAMVGGGAHVDFAAALKTFNPEQTVIKPDANAYRAYQKKLANYQQLVNKLAEFQTLSEITLL
nr:FGGY-family carbohydrate kinase [uncultured Tolumonas sp.]